MRFCRDNDCAWLVRLRGRDLYIPNARTPEEVAQARTRIADDPLPEGEAKAAVYQLWLMTKHENLATNDRNAKIAIYARGLTAYDRDAALLALSDFAHGDQFFPAWAELVSRIEGHMGDLGLMLTALRLHLTKETAP